MKKIIASILIILTISMTFIVTTYSQELDMNKFILESKIFSSELLSKKLVRFHVIANSDTDIDQNVKLQVKDAVLEDMVPKLNVSKSKEETIEIINANTENIKNIAKSTLEKNNMDNDVTVVLNTTFFPTKYYNDFSLPAGDYLALRVIIGSGEGQNWWCVLFPPLCLVDVKKEEPAEPIVVEEEDQQESKSAEELPPEEITSEKIVAEEPQIEKVPTKKLQSEKLPSKEIQLEESTVQEESLSQEVLLKKESNIDISLKIKEETQEKNQSTDKEKPKIRWKALELLGFYKNSQNQ